MPNLWDVTRLNKKVEEFIQIRTMISEFEFKKAPRVILTAHYEKPMELEVSNLEWREFIAKRGVKLAHELKEAGLVDASIENFLFTWSPVKKDVGK
jgi:hypothetical protein